VTTDAIRKLALVALEQDKAATKGPWFWNVNLKSKSIHIESGGLGHRFEYVMDFVRWGFSGAAPRFRNNAYIMAHAQVWSSPVVGREHHENWFRSLAHPDAEFIASARTREPLLAQALLVLLPYVTHMQDCGAWQAQHNDDGELQSGPCSCGLDTALAALGGEKTT
jgi:hypothetical protein